MLTCGNVNAIYVTAGQETDRPNGRSNAYGPAGYAARYAASGALIADCGQLPGGRSATANVGAALYVTVMLPNAGTVNVPVVRPVTAPFTAIAVTVPPVIVTLTGTGFGFGAATVVAASVIAAVNISGAAVTTADALSRSAPSSTK